MSGSSLIEASIAGHHDLVAELLIEGADVRFQDESAQTALMHAVLANDFVISRILLEAGSDPNQKNANGLSPFIAAGANGFSEQLELMLLYGADVTCVNRFGGTALLPSCEKGYLKTVQLCLEAGVQINHINRLGWSALHETVILGDGGYLYTLIAKLLLESGADAALKDRRGLSSADYAKILKQPQVEQLLGSGAAFKSFESSHLLSLFKEGKYEEGLVLVEGAFANEEKLELHFWRGLFLQEQKKYEQAKAAFMKGIAAKVGGEQFYFYVANCYRMMKRQKEALEVLDQAIVVSADPTFFLYHKSNYLREFGRHSEAIVAMKQLLESSPERTDYLFHQANSLAAIGAYEKAAKAMELAISLDAGNELYVEHRSQSLEKLTAKR